MEERSLFSKGAMEFVGTFILVMTASCNGTPASVAAVLIGIIYMSFELSSALYNPCVTLTFLLRGEDDARLCILYVPIQVLGGTAGGMVGRAMSSAALKPFVTGNGYSLSQALTCELAFTLALCFSVLTIALRKVENLIRYSAVCFENDQEFHCSALPPSLPLSLHLQLSFDKTNSTERAHNV